MKPFTFQTTRSVLCEVGATAKIGEIMAGRGCRKVAFVTDAMILKLGLAEAALDSLRKAGVDVWIFSEVVADPPEAMILGAVEAARAEGIDGVVSVGGGSSLDTAKLIAVLWGPSSRSRRCTASGSSRATACRWCSRRPRPAPARR
jgi:alcohol dehydrogenase class IV